MVPFSSPSSRHVYPFTRISDILIVVAMIDAIFSRRNSLLAVSTLVSKAVAIAPRSCDATQPFGELLQVKKRTWGRALARF